MYPGPFVRREKAWLAVAAAIAALYFGNIAKDLKKDELQKQVEELKAEVKELKRPTK
jgi:outer membrane murein-binding lipoprotein Lpp